MRAKALTEYVSALGRRCKIKVRLHSLRHFRVTELSHVGVDLATAASQQGNTREVMAQTYLHTNTDREQAAGELVAGVIGKALSAWPAPGTSGPTAQGPVSRGGVEVAQAHRQGDQAAPGHLG